MSHTNIQTKELLLIQWQDNKEHQLFIQTNFLFGMFLEQLELTYALQAENSWLKNRCRDLEEEKKEWMHKPSAWSTDGIANCNWDEDEFQTDR
ncbi:MAG: hypothetical protein ACK54E_22230 [Pseudanabaena sp.]|jgi:hypothetical protein